MLTVIIDIDDLKDYINNNHVRQIKLDGVNINELEIGTERLWYPCYKGHTEVVDPSISPTCTMPGRTAGKHCSVCGEIIIAQSVIPELGHEYESVVTDPTCTKQGYTTHTCTRSGCGHTYKDNYTEALGHSYGDWSVILEPTCTETGTKLRDCIRPGCAYYETETIAALGHDYTIVKTLPTCTEPGYTTYTCTRCDHSYVADQVPALGHSYASVVTDPTCTKQGYTTHTCTRCNDTYKDNYTEALGHIEVIDPYVAPTCTTTGLTEGSHCARCNEILLAQVALKELNHDFGDWVREREPTCTGTGFERRKCTRSGCTHSETNTIPPLGHSYRTEFVAPTCTERGYDLYICERCGDSYEDNYKEAHGHSWIDATCTEPRTCSICGATEGEALGHSYSSVVTDPTCTEQGYTTYTCTRSGCGHTYKDNYTEALGHSYSDWIIISDPTCIETGRQYRYCTITNCNAQEQETIPALGHIEVIEPAIAPTCTTTGRTEGSHCGRCMEVFKESSWLPALGHSWVDATCTTPKTCSTCGMTEGSALGHTWGAWTIELKPTCTTDGRNTRKCTVCNTPDVQIVSATGHASVEYPEVAATCTTAGYTGGTYCSTCNTVLTERTKIPATGHIWVDATCTTPKTCSKCGLTQGQAIGHSWVDATCTTPKTCSTCGMTEGSALGHTWGAWSVTFEPTCTTMGSSRRECSVCGDFEVKTAAATGHSWNAPTYSWNGYSSCTATRVCSNDSSHTETATATITNTVTTAATCITAGVRTYTATFSESWAATQTKTETIPADGVHSYSESVVEPTCTEQGYTIYTCDDCGTTYKDDYTLAIGHDWGEWKITTPATCEIDGTQERTCSRCGEVETQNIPATGHMNDVETIKPTCTEGGYTKYTCIHCGHTYNYDFTDPLGHMSTDWIIDAEPTTETEGSKHKECMRCGVVLETATIPKLEDIYLLAESGEYLTDEQGNKLIIEGG